jgi:hypothetical protein
MSEDDTKLKFKDYVIIAIVMLIVLSILTFTGKFF